MDRRILHVMPVDAPPERTTRVRTLLQGLAHEGTSIEVMSLPGGPRDLEHHVDDHRAVSMMLAALTGPRTGAEARAGGGSGDGRSGNVRVGDRVVDDAVDRVADGVVVGCFYDPGIRELREALDIPVMGIGEASMLVASGLGHRFSVLVGRAKWIPKMSDNALRYGFERRVASWRAVGVSVEEMHRDPAAAYVAVRTSAEAAVREDRAEVLVLGCAALEDTARRLQRDLGCPVVDPVIAGFKVVEMLADLHLRCGLTTSKLYDYRPKGAGGYG